MVNTIKTYAAASPCSGLPVTGFQGGLADAGSAMNAAQAGTHGTPTLVAVRKDDARVPEPRGRQR